MSVSDFSMIEPNNEEERLSFIHSITDAHGINAIHTGRNCKWFESHRENIQRSGVHLTTGSTGTHWFELADEKLLFRVYGKNGLPVVPSVRVRNVDELRTLLSHPLSLLIASALNLLQAFMAWDFGVLMTMFPR